MKFASLQPPSRSQKSHSAVEGAPVRALELSLLALALLLFASPVFAQTNPLVDRLPADTWAYVSWGGTASLKSVSSTNSVLRLWHDPAFSAFLENSIANVSHSGGPRKSGLTPEQSAEILSALENPAVIGSLNGPDDAAGQNHNPVHFFLIYDATGKQDLVDKLRRKRDADATQPAQVSSFAIGSITVEKRVSSANTVYEAQAGSYFIHTDSRRAMEELLPRFGGGRAPATSLGQSPDFPEACRGFSQSSILNVLVLPARFHLPAAAQSSGFDFRAFSSSLHLDGIRAGCFSVSFEKETTRTRGVVLGDTSQGILNVAGNNRDSFGTLPLASANSSFQVTVTDYAALYNSLFTAASAALPSDKAPFLAAGVAFLSSTWGMPPDQFFALFTGEAAVIYPDTAADPLQSFYAFAIRDPEKVLHVLQHGVPGEKASTSQEGDVTYLTVTVSIGAAAATSAAPSVYFALTPNMLLASKEQEAVRQAVVRVHAAAGAVPSDPLSADPDFQKARALLPAKLDGLSYGNYAHYNWQKLFSETEKNLNTKMQGAARNSKRPVPTLAQIFQGLDPAVLSRYLHVSIGGSWKDPTGIYFDSYIQ
ncbi:MAG: hypothetical protein WA020_03665 [Candidatus Acidiferrales bacterium]